MCKNVYIVVEELLYHTEINKTENSTEFMIYNESFKAFLKYVCVMNTAKDNVRIWGLAPPKERKFEKRGGKKKGKWGKKTYRNSRSLG